MSFKSLTDEISRLRSPKRLLMLSEQVKHRLHDAGIGRGSWSDPMSHYAEWLTQRVFGGELAVHSNPAYDLLDRRNRRIQVKARVSRIAKGQAGIVERRSSRGLSVKTDNIGDFDYLVLVVFLPETFDVALALGVPNDIFRKIGKKSGDGVRRRLPSGESIRNI